MMIRLIAALTLLSGFTLFAEEAKPKPSLTLKIIPNYLALEVEGTAPADSAALEYRWAESGDIPESAAWLPVGGGVDKEGQFKFAVALQTSRWSALQVRALKEGKELAKKSTRWRGEVYEWLTPEAIAARPEAERAAWTAYMARSEKARAVEFDTLAAECRELKQAQSVPAPQSSVVAAVDSDTPESWFAQPETIKLAEAAMSFQTPSGGWSKAVDYSQGPRKPGMHWTSQKGDPWHYCGTIDNRSTTEQIKLLAGVFTATKREEIKAATLRGIEYLLAAQYPNGGWPQNYPVESGYHEAVTLNDNAMVHVLEVLLAIIEAKPPFAFTDEALRQRAQAAFDKGISCIAAMQVKLDGKLTVWCAQHHPLTLEPAHARTKEPPSLSGGETAELLKFLMRKAPITPEVTAMIEPAITWLDEHKLTGLRKGKNAAGKTDYLEDPASTELYWARFYDLKTGKAIFPGAQDGINYPTFREMAAKNKVAYDFMVTKPAEIISKEFPRWQSRLAKQKKK